MSLRGVGLPLEAQGLRAKGSTEIAQLLVLSPPTHPRLVPRRPGDSCFLRVSFRLHFGFASRGSVQKTGSTEVRLTALSLTEPRRAFRTFRTPSGTHSRVLTEKQVTKQTPLFAVARRPASLHGWHRIGTAAVSQSPRISEDNDTSLKNHRGAGNARCSPSPPHCSLLLRLLQGSFNDLIIFLIGSFSTS